MKPEQAHQETGWDWEDSETPRHDDTQLSPMDCNAPIREGLAQLLELTGGERIRLTLINPKLKDNNVKAGINPKLKDNKKLKDNNVKAGGWLSPDTLDEAIERTRQAQDNGWNVYWCPNSINPSFDRAKPAKADTETVRALYVDLDPVEGVDREQARRDCLSALEGLPEDLKPTAIIDSGGGYQAFWMLDKPHPAAEIGPKAETLGKRLGEGFKGPLFKSDNVQNIDRVMRVPGTMNYPNLKKQKAGRKASPARMVEMDPTRRYALDELRTALGFTEGVAKAVAVSPARLGHSRETLAALPVELKADMAVLVPALQNDEDFSHLWWGRYTEAKNSDGKPFTDRSNAVHSLLLRIINRLPGDMTIGRLMAVAEQSQMIGTVYADKWNRDDQFAANECSKALADAEQYRLEEAKRLFAEALAKSADTSDSAISPCTDLANARRLREKYKGDIAYTKHLGPMIWTGTYWRPN